jgi:uncharacterized iron-regulated protein
MQNRLFRPEQFFFRAACASLLLTMLAACAPLPPDAAPPPGQVWQSSERRFVPFDNLLQQARAADIVLLGETHDNAAHHALQQRLLAALAVETTRPALVMEQFDIEQQERLDAIMVSSAARDIKLAAYKALMKEGWEWQGYQPLLALAIDHGLPVLAANISRASLREVMRGGQDALGSGEAQRLGMASGWRSEQQAALARDMADSHCDALPPAAIDALTLAQRARDAVMADRLLSVRGAKAVAILGRGHVRQDLAVPLYLKQRAPRTRVLAVGMVEDTPPFRPEQVALGPLGQRFDTVVFTGVVKRDADPCAAFQKKPVAPASQ